MKEQHKFASIFRIVAGLLILIPSLALPGPKPTIAQPITFGDPAFARQWNYSDKAVKERGAKRSWLWGPPLLPGRNERLIGSPARGATTPAGYHLVQYFDKARMEFNAKDRIVTNGRLVVEMMSGDIQIGLRSNEYFTIRPARLAIAGDTEEGRVHPNNGAVRCRSEIYCAPGGKTDQLGAYPHQGAINLAPTIIFLYPTCEN